MSFDLMQQQEEEKNQCNEAAVISRISQKIINFIEDNKLLLF